MTRPLRAPEARSLQLRLLGGLVLWVTTLYCGPARRSGQGRGREGTGIYPELAVLGFREGSSPALASLVARQTALLASYEVARDELAQQGLPLDLKVIHRIGRQVGADVLASRRRDLYRYRAGQLPAGQTLAGKRVGVAIDGGRVRIRTYIRKVRDKRTGQKRRRRYRAEWKEPKLLIIFEMNAHGRMVRGSRPWIDGTFAGPDEIMELVALHLHRLGAAAATLVAFLADGAPWIWERLAWVTQRVGLSAHATAYVLDWCHAVHHISLALAALDLTSDERQRWFKQLRGWLRAGKPYDVTCTLSLLAEERGKPAAALTAIAFLEKHAEADHLSYRSYRRRGVPQGSGAIESTIRRVVNLRLKGNGITWLKENAEALLVLRAAAVTQRWQETMEQARTAMALDRCCDWKWTSPDMPAELKSGVPIRPPQPQSQENQCDKEAAA